MPLPGKIEFNTFLEMFFDLERRANLFDYKIQDMPLWDFVRHAVFNQVKFAVTSIENVQARHSWFFKILNAIKDLIVLCFYIFVVVPFRKKTLYDVLVINIEGRVEIDKKKVSVYHHFPLIHLSKKYRTLSVEAGNPSWFKSKSFCWDRFYLRPFSFRSKIKTFFFKFTRDDENVFQEINDIIEKQFGIRVNLKSGFLFHFFQYKNYLALLKRFNPKMLLFVNNGCVKGAIYAAKKCSVFSAEMQHCIISEVNPEYQYPKDLVEQKHPGLVHPDFIFTWGSIWNPIAQIKSKPIEVGFPYLEWEKRSLDHRYHYIQRDPKRILIISNGSSRGPLVDIALTLAKRLPDYTVVYKLRSDDFRRWKKRYPRGLRDFSNIEVVDKLVPSFYEHLCMASIQIGANSTGLLEGILFGLETFILKHGIYREMKIIFDNPLVHIVSSADEIIQRLRNNREKRESIFDFEPFFKSNAFENLEKTIAVLVTHRMDSLKREEIPHD